eukprot:evm.model.scf_479.12 EVM.evm.TU.scf_479.12   scf_479:80326-83432(-)
MSPRRPISSSSSDCPSNGGRAPRSTAPGWNKNDRWSGRQPDPGPFRSRAAQRATPPSDSSDDELGAPPPCRVRRLEKVSADHKRTEARVAAPECGTARPVSRGEQAANCGSSSSSDDDYGLWVGRSGSAVAGEGATGAPGGGKAAEAGGRSLNAAPFGPVARGEPLPGRTPGGESDESSDSDLMVGMTRASGGGGSRPAHARPKGDAPARDEGRMERGLRGSRPAALRDKGREGLSRGGWMRGERRPSECGAVCDGADAMGACSSCSGSVCGAHRGGECWVREGGARGAEGNHGARSCSSCSGSVCGGCFKPTNGRGSGPGGGQAPPALSCSSCSGSICGGCLRNADKRGAVPRHAQSPGLQSCSSCSGSICGGRISDAVRRGGVRACPSAPQSCSSCGGSVCGRRFERVDRLTLAPRDGRAPTRAGLSCSSCSGSVCGNCFKNEEDRGGGRRSRLAHSCSSCSGSVCGDCRSGVAAGLDGTPGGRPRGSLLLRRRNSMREQRDHGGVSRRVGGRTHSGFDEQDLDPKGEERSLKFRGGVRKREASLKEQGGNYRGLKDGGLKPRVGKVCVGSSTRPSAQAASSSSSSSSSSRSIRQAVAICRRPRQTESEHSDSSDEPCANANLRHRLIEREDKGGLKRDAARGPLMSCSTSSTCAGIVRKTPMQGDLDVLRATSEGDLDSPPFSLHSGADEKKRKQALVSRGRSPRAARGESRAHVSWSQGAGEKSGPHRVEAKHTRLSDGQSSCTNSTRTTPEGWDAWERTGGEHGCRNTRPLQDVSDASSDDADRLRKCRTDDRPRERSRDQPSPSTDRGRAEPAVTHRRPRSLACGAETSGSNPGRPFDRGAAPAADGAGSPARAEIISKGGAERRQRQMGAEMRLPSGPTSSAKHSVKGVDGRLGEHRHIHARPLGACLSDRCNDGGHEAMNPEVSLSVWRSRTDESGRASHKPQPRSRSLEARNRGEFSPRTDAEWEAVVRRSSGSPVERVAGGGVGRGVGRLASPPIEGRANDEWFANARGGVAGPLAVDSRSKRAP